MNVPLRQQEVLTGNKRERLVDFWAGSVQAWCFFVLEVVLVFLKPLTARQGFVFCLRIFDPYIV